MPDSLLSVIVPVYNTAPWLARCLDSICAQTYRNLEILCVNDGSTDNSAEVLAEYAAKDSRIKVFTQKNAGLSAARNTALDHASGEWITGVDSDDWLEIEAYEHAMRSTAGGVDMVWFGTRIEGEGPETEYAGRAEYYRVKLDGVQELNEDVCHTMDANFWNKLYRTSILRKYDIRFPEGLLYEDIPFFHAYTCVANRVACIPDRYYHYVQRASSIMGLTRELTPRSVDHVRVLAFFAAFLKTHHLNKEERLIYLLERYYRDAIRFCTPEMLQVLHREAYQFACSTGIISRLSTAIMRTMRHGCAGPIKRFFLQQSETRWSIGFGSLHVFTITYTEAEEKYWLLGRKFGKRQLT